MMFCKVKSYPIVTLFFTVCCLVLFSRAHCSSQLVYSTFLGGSNDTSSGNGMALDSAGNVYITGYTESITFPVTASGLSTTYKGTQGSPEAFVTQINTNSSGTASLVYSTYLGGKGYDYLGTYVGDVGQAITVDPSGNVYITGYTSSTDFPVTSTAFNTTFVGPNPCVFITKLKTNSSGTTSLLYSTFLGGEDGDYGNAIAVDSAGNIYITGQTKSSNFPTTANAYDTNFHTIFLSEINPSLSGVSSLVYSTYFGGSNSINGNDQGFAITVNTSGNIFLTGIAYSSNFPVTSTAFSSTYQGGFVNSEAYISEFNTNYSGKSSLIYSTYLGGSGGDQGNGIVVDASGNVYVTGVTGSTNFPITSNAYNTTYHSIFVSKLNPSISGVSSLLYSTFLGGSGSDQANAIAVNANGNIYITGQTKSSNFPSTNGFSTTYIGGANGEAFISKINPNSSGTASLNYSTYLGGNGGDAGLGIAVDSSENVYVTGYTSSANFPITPSAISTSLRGSQNAFVTKLAVLVPIAGFYGTPTSGNGPLGVTFHDLSSNNPSSWNWNFGDGVSTTTQNPTHNYGTVAVATAYTVQLVVSNSYGNSTAIIQNYIHVKPVAAVDNWKLYSVGKKNSREIILDWIMTNKYLENNRH